MKKTLLSLLLALAMLLGTMGAVGMAEEKIDFEIMHLMSETTKNSAVDAICAAVNEQFGGNVNFINTHLTQAQYNTTIRTRLAAGDPPQMIWGRPGTYPEMIENGYVLDLSDWDFVNHLNDIARAAASDSEGHVYSICFDKLCFMTFYNKDIFEAEGLKVPTNLNEQLEVQKYFADKGEYAFVRGYLPPNELPLTEYNARCRWQFAANNPTFFTDIMAGTQIASDSEYWCDAWRAYGEVLSFPREDDMGKDVDEMYQMFASGKYAMMTSGTWCVGEIKKYNPDINMGAFPIYTLNGEGLCMQIDGSLMVSSSVAGTPAEDVAKALCDYIVSPEGVSTWLEYAQTVPATDDPVAAEMESVIADIQALDAKGQVYNTGVITDFTGEFWTRWAELCTEFAALNDYSEESVNAFIEYCDDEFAAIVAKNT